MIDDIEPLIPEDPIEDEDLGLDDEGNPKVKKPKDLIDDDTVSLEDEAEEELDEEDDDYGDGDDKYE
jgi:hypothetical protein